MKTSEQVLLELKAELDRLEMIRAGAPVGNKNAEGPHQFTSKEQAQTVKGLLEDFKKQGIAKPGHLQRLKEANEYLGIKEPQNEEPENTEKSDAAVSRAQGAMDSFHRTVISPLREQLEKEKSSLKKLSINNRLREATSVHDVARDLFKEHLPANELEERVKGLLMHGRQITQ